MVETITRILRPLIPRALFEKAQPFYHFVLALGGTILYRFPSQKLIVIGVTGTKGKSTVVALIAACLKAAGHRVATTSTVSFTINGVVTPNRYKMSMPGRFFMQQFLRKAVAAECTHAVIEVTSEGAKTFRHRFIDFDALVFTNLTPEHIESHGSFEKYKDAKLSIAHRLATSKKPRRVLIANGDDPHAHDFLTTKNLTSTSTYSLADAAPHNTDTKTSTFTLSGTEVTIKLPGTFNIQNALAAAKTAEAFGVSKEHIIRALETFPGIRGRVEYVECGQPFAVVVDYAHTAESLKAFYDIFKGGTNICVLGNTGGGRDKSKRPIMAHIAETHCDSVVLTNEDPYDEDPEAILRDMANGVQNKKKLRIILDRKQAFAEALKEASEKAAHGKTNVHVLITGKGTDPYIMGPRGKKIPWDDATVVRELLTNAGH